MERLMVTPQSIQQFVKAQPFRPFQIRTAGGQVYEVRHPEMVKVLRSTALVFPDEDNPEFPESFEMVSSMLTEGVAPLDVKSKKGNTSS
jgi:hypothetical protein